MPTTLRSRLPIAAGFSALAVFALTLVAGCNSSKPISVAAASPPNVVAVGPIPGAQAEPPGTPNPYAGNPVAIQDGRRLFNWYNCSGCHGGHGGGGMGPSLRDQTWLYGNRDDQIFNSIAEGRSKGMPSWGPKVPENQIWELVAYLKTLRTPLEADPPVEPMDEKVGPPSPQEPAGVPMTMTKK